MTHFFGPVSFKGGCHGICGHRSWYNRRNGVRPSLPIVTGQRRRPHLPCCPNLGHKDSSGPASLIASPKWVAVVPKSRLRQREHILHGKTDWRGDMMALHRWRVIRNWPVHRSRTPPGAFIIKETEMRKRATLSYGDLDHVPQCFCPPI